MRCIPPSQKCISSRQMTDNTSEVETNNCVWRTWRGHLFHVLITQVFRRSLEYGIVVMGVLDAFVYAHNCHRRNIDNLEISVIAWKGRIRFMTAITPAYAHAYQFICPAGNIPVCYNTRRRHWFSQVDHLHWRGTSFCWWWNFGSLGCYRSFAWPAVTTEAHPAYAGARIHSNNTAELSSIVEALSFLGPRGLVACDAHSCNFFDSRHAVGVCLGTVHARAHEQLGLSCQQLSLKVQHRLRFTVRHVHSHVENLGNECADRRIGCIWIGVESWSLHTLGASFIWFQLMLWYTPQPWWSLGKLRDMRTSFVSASLRPEAGVPFHAVLCCGLSCTHHRRPWSIFIRSLPSVVFGPQVVWCAAQRGPKENW